MSENQISDPQPSVASLVGGILEDGQKLVRQELALARREVAESCEKAKTGVALLTGALAVGSVAGILLAFMLVKLLHQFLLRDHEWACFGIVGGVFALIGGVLFQLGRSKISEVQLSLPQTVGSLRDNAQAVGAAVSEGQSAVASILKR